MPERRQPIVGYEAGLVPPFQLQGRSENGSLALYDIVRPIGREKWIGRLGLTYLPMHAGNMALNAVHVHKFELDTHHRRLGIGREVLKIIPSLPTAMKDIKGTEIEYVSVNRPERPADDEAFEAFWLQMQRERIVRATPEKNRYQFLRGLS